MGHGLLGGRSAECGFTRLKPGLDRFRNVASTRIVIAEYGGPTALSDRRLLTQPRCDARMELTPFLVEQRGVGDFLYHHVLESEQGGLRLLDPIHDASALQRLQRMLQRFSFAWKHIENTVISELPSKHGSDLGDALGGNEAIKAFHQWVLNT